MAITITHTRAEGTIVGGTAKGDGSAEILKAAGFRWAPSLRAWIVAQSRDRAAATWKIDRAAEGLRAAGFEVDVAIDETPRAFAEAEADRAERAEERADRLASRADRAGTAAAAAYQAARDEAALIPPGQPILVGHHSERGHRAALKRIDQRMARSIEEDRKATHYERAAEVASRYTERREALGTTLRRIEKLEADERRIQRDMEPCPTSGRGPTKPDAEGRKITCPRCCSEVTITDLHVPEHGRNVAMEWAGQRLAEIHDEVAYWRQVVAEQEATGAKVWSRADFAKGDRVLDDFGRWHEVLRVNAKSLTVPTPYSWTETIPYDKVRGKRAGDAR
jgi:hypothetical protein